MPPVDPNAVLMTGENSFIRLSKDGGQAAFDSSKSLACAVVPGRRGARPVHAKRTTGESPRVYSDNAGVTRWLQRNIETYLSPASAAPSLPIVSACFSRYGDPRGTTTETIFAGEDTITLTWYDCLDPFVLTVPPGQPPERPIGVFSTFFPALGAQVELNGKLAEGEVWAEKRGDRDSTSACLAWSEDLGKAQRLDRVYGLVFLARKLIFSRSRQRIPRCLR